ncbi:hypothetical protein L9F63_002212, partial [Diploptera punctata]
DLKTQLQKSLKMEMIDAPSLPNTLKSKTDPYTLSCGRNLKENVTYLRTSHKEEISSLSLLSISDAMEHGQWRGSRLQNTRFYKSSSTPFYLSIAAVDNKISDFVPNIINPFHKRGLISRFIKSTPNALQYQRTIFSIIS